MNAPVSTDTPAYEGWTILELMGHRRLAGYVREQVVGGSAFIRIDVPGDGDAVTATQFYSPSAVYCMTPTTEDLARKVAKGAQPAPVTRWDLPSERTLPAPRDTFNPDEDEDDE
jgi:hypothetical protein